MPIAWVSGVCLGGRAKEVTIPSRNAILMDLSTPRSQGEPGGRVFLEHGQNRSVRTPGRRLHRHFSKGRRNQHAGLFVPEMKKQWSTLPRKRKRPVDPTSAPRLPGKNREGGGIGTPVEARKTSGGNSVIPMGLPDGPQKRLGSRFPLPSGGPPSPAATARRAIRAPGEIADSEAGLKSLQVPSLSVTDLDRLAGPLRRQPRPVMIPVERRAVVDDIDERSSMIPEDKSHPISTAIILPSGLQAMRSTGPVNSAGAARGCPRAFQSLGLCSWSRPSGLE